MRTLLGKMVMVKMDRPLGSRHPKYGFVYPLNYGYLPGVLAGDGEELDAYVIGEFEPLEVFEGYVVALIHRHDDVEDKLVVCREKDKYNQSQVEALVEFQERFFKTSIEMGD